MVKTSLLLLIVVLASGCTTSPPKNVNNLCEIFFEKDDWYEDAKQSYERWGVPIHVTMAIIYQESRFVADARPPRTKLLGFIPWSRPSSAYGYAQAIDGTWQTYEKSTDQPGNDRDDFADAIDFVGWYCANNNQQLGISKWDARHQYFAYHEGYRGYKRRTYLRKPWLKKVAELVKRQSTRYSHQLSGCKDDLESKSWFFW